MEKRWLVAILILLNMIITSQRAEATKPAPVSCVFDLSAVIIDPDHIKAVKGRLRENLVPELRGTEEDSPLRLRFAVTLEGGAYHCRIFFAHIPDAEVLLDGITVNSLTDLAALANQQATSKRLWLGRIVNHSESTWQAEALLPSAPEPHWLTSPSKGGLWRMVPAANDNVPGRGVAVEKISGPDLTAGELLVPLIVEHAKVVLTVKDSHDLPRRDVQIYGSTEHYPDPRQLDTSDFLGVSDHKGQVHFAWNHMGPCYLLTIRDGVPLTNYVFIPTKAEMSIEITVPSKWSIGGNSVGLDEYVLAKRKDFAALREEHRRKQDVFETTRKLISEGQWDKALSVLDSLAVSDRITQELRQEILDKKQSANIAELLHAADLERKDKNYEAAIGYLQKAIALSKGVQQQEIAERIHELTMEMQEHYRRTAPASKLIFEELPGLTTTEIISNISRIENAVEILCSAGRASELLRAADQLTQTITLLDIAMRQRLEEMKRLQIPSDTQYNELGQTRERLHEKLNLISTAIKN